MLFRVSKRVIIELLSPKWVPKIPSNSLIFPVPERLNPDFEV
jgi:hypothetical protein